MEDTTVNGQFEVHPRIIEFIQEIAGGDSSLFWVQVGCLGVAMIAFYWIMFRPLGRFDRTPTRTDVQLERIGIWQVRHRRSLILLLAGALFSLTALLVAYETDFLERWETYVVNSFPEPPEELSEDVEGYGEDLHEWLVAFPVDPTTYLDRMLLLFVIFSGVSAITAVMLNRTERLCWFRTVAYFRREGHRKNERSFAMADWAIGQIVACDLTKHKKSFWFELVTRRLNPMTTDRQNAEVTERLAAIEKQANGHILSSQGLRGRFGNSIMWSFFCLAVGILGFVALWLALVFAELPATDDSISVAPVEGQVATISEQPT